MKVGIILIKPEEISCRPFSIIASHCESNYRDLHKRHFQA